MRQQQRLGIAALRTFSICRMVNVDVRSPKLHSSLNAIIDETNGWVFELGMDVWKGALRAVVHNSCKRRPSDFDEERETFGEIARLSPENMVVLCMENLQKSQVIDALFTEMELHRLGSIKEIRGRIIERFVHCFLEPQ